MMTEEKTVSILEELATYLKKITPLDGEEAKQEEIQDVEDSIARYQLEVEELRYKLSENANYKRHINDDSQESDSIEGFLEILLEEERKQIADTMANYRKLQETANKNLIFCDNLLGKLREKFDNIERRLRKDALAKQKGIVKKSFLTEEEVRGLEEEKSFIIAEMEKLNGAIEYLADQIRDFGRMITENEARLRNVNDKEKRFSSIINANVVFPQSEIDFFIKVQDKDELFKKETGLQALENRLKVLTYDPVEKIETLLRSQGVVETPSNAIFSSEFKISETEEQVGDNSDERLAREEYAVEIGNPIQRKEDDSKIQANVNQIIDELFQNEQEQLEDVTEESREESIEHRLEQPEEQVWESLSSYVGPREMLEIQDGTKELKDEKKSESFLSIWNSWVKQMSAASVATAFKVIPDLQDSMNQDNLENTIPEVEPFNDEGNRNW